MRYYIGFLKQHPKHAVLFKSVKVPKREDFKYFVSVSGPYESEREARHTLDVLKKSYGMNPAYSERQRLFTCAELGRLRAGEPRKTKMTEEQLRDFCRKDNPVISHRKALGLTKKIIAYAKKLFKHEQAGVRENPGIDYHYNKFVRHMKELEKYVVGSKPYIEALARAYEHLESIKASKE